MKEFDIYLNKRLTECDIIVYSIPYRGGLTAINRLVLESCIENYTLIKFMAVQTGSELISHIDDMLKTCYERLNWGMDIDTSAKFNVLYSIHPKVAAVELPVDKVKLVKMLAISFTEAENALQIAAAPLLAFVGNSIGGGESTIELRSTVKDTLKNSIDKFSPQMELDAKAIKTNKQGFLDIECDLPVASEVINLCYQIGAAVD